MNDEKDHDGADAGNALSKPAPVDANASAEARLREASHNIGECDPVVIPDWAGADTEFIIAQAICRSDKGPGVPSCVMDDHPERDPCNFSNCRRFEQAREVIKALSPDPRVSDCAAKTIYDVLGDQKAHVDASDCAKQGETTKSEDASRKKGE